jgi:hypothetical protein
MARDEGRLEEVSLNGDKLWSRFDEIKTSRKVTGDPTQEQKKRESQFQMETQQRRRADLGLLMERTKRQPCLGRRAQRWAYCSLSYRKEFLGLDHQGFGGISGEQLSGTSRRQLDDRLSSEGTVSAPSRPYYEQRAAQHGLAFRPYRPQGEAS